MFIRPILTLISDGAFTLIGFEPRDTVPIAFPLDICLMEMQSTLYAACLHLNAYRTRNDTSLTIFKRIVSVKANGAKADCASNQSKYN